jgi:serine/threonine protein kinase
MFRSKNSIWLQDGKEIIGSFATLSVISNNETREKVVLKRYKKQQLVQALQEFKILHSLNHPNIIKILGFSLDNTIIVLPYIKHGDLFDYIIDNTSGPDTIKQIFTDIVSTVDYLHDLDICHRDLKLENILVEIKENSFIKIILCDFGMARDITSEKKTIKKQGTDTYMAPELYFGENLCNIDLKKVDVWALGIILYILLERRLPILGSIPKIQWETNLEASRLSSKILDLEPSERFSCKDILNHVYCKID